jgi:hypothetical protein
MAPVIHLKIQTKPYGLVDLSEIACDRPASHELGQPKETDMANDNDVSGLSSDPVSPLRRRNRRGLLILWCGAPRHAPRIRPLPANRSVLHGGDAGRARDTHEAAELERARLIMDTPPQKRRRNG